MIAPSVPTNRVPILLLRVENLPYDFKMDETEFLQYLVDVKFQTIFGAIYTK